MSYLKNLLGANEQIVFPTHRHFFVLLSEVFKELLILLIVLAVYVFLSMRDQGFPYMDLAFPAIALVVFVSMLIDFFRWRNEEYIVTSRRVIHVKGVLSKNIMDSSLSKINDVILQQSFLGRIFGYGTIKILTASDEVINLLASISNPVRFKQAMLNAKAELEPIAGAVAAAPAASATQLLEELSQLRQRNMISDAEYEEKRKDILKRM